MNETLYKQKLKNLKDTLIVKDGVFSDKYLFFHELISTSAFIESSILDLYKSKMNSKMPTSVVEALKRMKEKESTLWNVREIFKKFYLSFKRNVDVKQLQDKITGGKIGMRQQMLIKRGLLDDLAARHIDQDRIGLHPAQFTGPD